MKNRPLKERMGFALAGLRAAIASESSVRTELLALVGWVGVLCWLQPAAIWWALSLALLALVLAVELLNSSLETLADHLHPERHPAIGRAKDVAAGAVFVLVLASLLVGMLTLWSVLGPA
ncbi:MAG: diacylglycerol kinase [Planctomycetota bacterium]